VALDPNLDPNATTRDIRGRTGHHDRLGKPLEIRTKQHQEQLVRKAVPDFEVRTPHRGRFSSNSFHSKHLARFQHLNKPSVRDLIHRAVAELCKADPQSCQSTPALSAIDKRSVATASGMPSAGRHPGRRCLYIGWFYRAPAELIRGARCFGPSTTTSAPIFTRL
jgi:hypothetical protein